MTEILITVSDQEELDFLQEVMNTEVMKTALQYLQDRGSTI